MIFLGALVLSSPGRAQLAITTSPVSDLKKLSLEELTQVEVISVSRQPQKLIQTASAIQVITGNEIRRSGYTTIPDALRLADNLNVAQKDPHDWAISARGFNSNLGDKLLVLMDGRTVYTPLFSGVFWNSQDYLLEDINQIEVVSGPGGTLWGANAVNGVINITSKSAKDTQGWYVEGGGGSELEGFTGIRYGTTLAPNVYLRTYLKYLAYDDGALANGAPAHDGWKQGQAGFRLDAEPTRQDAVSVHGDYYSGNLDVQSGGSARLAGENIVGRWSHSISEDSDASLQLYYDRTHLKDPFGASPYAPAGFLIDDLDTYDLDFQHRFAVAARNQIVWGLGYRITDDDVRQAAPNFAFLPPHLKQVRYDAFVQDEIALAENIFASVGSKLEHNAYTGWEVEPTARLRWQLSSSQNAWASMSRAVRMPSRLDRDLAEPGPPNTLIMGGKNFQSETVFAYELGYRAQISDRVSGSFSVFYNDYDQLRGLSTTPVTVLPLFYENALEGETYGLELSGDILVTDGWRLHVGYNLLKEDIRVKPGHVDFFHALDETEDPENQISVRSSTDLPHDLQLDLLFRWIDKLQVNNGGKPGIVPSYSELNVRIGWQATPSLELSLVGQNLLHAQHAEFGAPSATREEIERRVFGKFAWKF